MERSEALNILKTRSLTDEETQKLFFEVARKLEISEGDLRDLHNLPECMEKFKSQKKFYNIGIKIYEKLGVEKRIRK